MARTDRPSNTEARGTSVEDLGEDIVVLASIAAERGSASMVRSVNGKTFRVVVEAA